MRLYGIDCTNIRSWVVRPYEAIRRASKQGIGRVYKVRVYRDSRRPSHEVTSL